MDNLSVEKMFDYEWDYGEIDRIIEKKRKYATVYNQENVFGVNKNE